MAGVPHDVQRAKFPVIDVHTHTNDARGSAIAVDPKEMVARMDRPQRQRRVVILTAAGATICKQSWTRWSSLSPDASW